MLESIESRSMIIGLEVVYYFVIVRKIFNQYFCVSERGYCAWLPQ